MCAAIFWKFLQKIIIFALILKIAQSYDEKAWKEASRYLSEAMDVTVDPCEDFYGFVCGKWGEKFSTPYITRESSKSAQEVATDMTAKLAEYDTNPGNLHEYQKSLKYFVDNCKAKLPASNEELIADIYKSLDAYFVPKIVIHDANGTEKMPWEIVDGQDKLLWQYAGVLLREQHVPFLMDVTIGYVYENCSMKPVLQIEPPKRAMSDPLDMDVLNLLLKQVIGFHNVTFDEKEIKDTADEIIALEKDLVALVRNAPYKALRGVNIAKLAESVPNVDWDHYFEALIPDDIRNSWLTQADKTKVHVLGVNYLNGIKEIVKKYGNDTVYNYGYAMVIQRYYNLFKKGITPNQAELESGFAYSGILQSINPCLYLAFQYLPSASARFIFDVYDVNPNDWRYGINLIVESILSAFRFLVYSVDWMDSSDKVLISEKVNQLQYLHVVPDWLSSLEKVNAKTPKYDFNLSLIANDIITRRVMFEDTMRPLVTGVKDEPVPSFEMNAYYGGGNIQILLGMMLPPMYNDRYPLSVRYGGVGFISGHELMHGFDSDGIKEKYPKAPRWLKPESLKQYNLRAQCLVQQYSKYCFKDAQACVAGHISLDDNIADVEGLKAAFAAYKFQSAINEEIEKPLPGNLQNYTHDQLFYISMARTWCNSLSADKLKQMVFKSHAPDSTRVNLPVTNSRSFAKAFKCHVGSTHAPIKTCSLWGSIWDD